MRLRRTDRNWPNQMPAKMPWRDPAEMSRGPRGGVKVDVGEFSSNPYLGLIFACLVMEDKAEIERLGDGGVRRGFRSEKAPVDMLNTR